MSLTLAVCEIWHLKMGFSMVEVSGCIKSSVYRIFWIDMKIEAVGRTSLFIRPLIRGGCS